MCNNKFKTNLFNVRHSTKSKTSKLSVHNSWQPHFIHMYFNMEVFPMPAGAWTVITVGKDGPGHGIDQHFPNISSIRTDSTAPRNLNKKSSSNQISVSGIKKENSVKSTLQLPEISPAPLTGRVKYWTILARSSISNLAAFFVLICDMTNFWWRFFRRFDRRRCIWLLFWLWANCVPGSNQSE